MYVCACACADKQRATGEISLDELATVMLARMTAKSSIKLTDVGEELFEMFDKDGEGEISLDEIMDTFKSLGKNWAMEVPV